MLDRLGMGALLDAPVADLSGGQAKRVALARRRWWRRRDLLILDEPTNHLDIDAIAWLEDRLAAYRGGLVLVTHDRHFLDRVTTRVLELDRGRGYVHEGGYDAYLEGRAEREEQAAKAEDRRRNLARTELAWLRRGAPARTSKPKARIEAATADRGGPGRGRGPPRRPAAARRHARGSATRSWSCTAWATASATARGCSGASTCCSTPASAWASSGPTARASRRCWSIMAGRLDPAEGHVEVGSTVRSATTTSGPRPGPRPAGARRRGRGHRRGRLARRRADGGVLVRRRRPVGARSACSRAASAVGCSCCWSLAERPNVLLLDEPTNDLDLDTLRQLEDFLEDWPGALVVVSHDRAFLERTVADVIVLDGDGRAGRRPGGYAAYEEERRRRAGAGAGAAQRRRRRPPGRPPKAGRSRRPGADDRRRQPKGGPLGHAAPPAQGAEKERAWLDVGASPSRPQVGRCVGRPRAPGHASVTSWPGSPPPTPPPRSAGSSSAATDG